MTRQEFRILVLGAGNVARSLIAEALFNHLGRGRVKAFSAGARPATRPHAIALELLERHGLSTLGLHCKGWDAFCRPGAPEMDVALTVCDDADPRPALPGSPVAVHWRLPDPAAAAGPHAEQLVAFEETYRLLKDQIERLLAEPVETMAKPRLQALMEELTPQR